MTSKLKSLNYFFWPIYTRFVIATTALVTTATFALGIGVLVLGRKGIISIDALAGVAFALSPALLSFPKHIFQYTHCVYLMTNRRSLNVPAPNQRCIEAGNPCGQYRNRYYWTERFGSCGGPSCGVNMFLRRTSRSGCVQRSYHCYADSVMHTTPASLKKYLARFVRSEQGEEERRIAQHRYAFPVDHTENHVVLQDVNEGETCWWWYQLSSSECLLQKPKIVQFRDFERRLNAMELISDIYSIGDLVWMHRGDYLKWSFRSEPAMKEAVESTVGFSCNLVMEQMGLSGWWGSVGSDTSGDGVEFAESSTKKYGLMFFILTVTSELYMSKNKLPSDENENHEDYKGWGARRHGHRLSGQDILDDLECEAKSLLPPLFGRKSSETVDKWLRDWGCSAGSFQRFQNFQSSYEVRRPCRE